MSIPKNHHYVSQCHLREFFNSAEGKIFIYDKEIDNHYYKTTTKTLFSEQFLNSKEINGEIDHQKLELELKVLIEDEFGNHVERVKSFINNPVDQNRTNESLIWLSMIGVIGELRHPVFKKSLDSIEEIITTDLRNDISGDASHLIKRLFPGNQRTKYSNILEYINSACRVLEQMEPLVFGIYFIESDEYFILPDTSGYQIRGQFYPVLIRYINQIIQVGFPLSPKIFILASSRKSGNLPSGICTIKNGNSDIVYNINKDLLGFAYKAVVCSDKDYLRRFIDKVKTEFT
ncbi:MAG: DUF4238 domain-containing protein [Ferruginibacter sp.]